MKKKYLVYLYWWGPVGLAVALSLWISWVLRPEWGNLQVPALPEIYRKIPQAPPEVVRYAPRGPVLEEAFRKLSPRTSEGSASARKSLQLTAVLRLGDRRICRINQKIYNAGQKVAGFIIKEIGDNYVVLERNGRLVRLYLGERLSY